MVTASCGSKLYAHSVRGPGLGGRTCFGYSTDHEIGLCFETHTAPEGQHQLAEAILYCSVDIGHRSTRALEAQPSVVRVARTTPTSAESTRTHRQYCCATQWGTPRHGIGSRKSSPWTHRRAPTASPGSYR